MYIHSVADEWNRILPQHLWIYNKLFLSRRLGYTCGPMGLEVPEPGFYVISPCTCLLECQSRVEYIGNSTHFDKCLGYNAVLTARETHQNLLPAVGL